jgi:hypothetical protein
LIGEKVEHPVVVNEMHALCVKAYEVCAVFAVLLAFARFDAKQVSIGAIDAFSQRDAGFGNRDATFAADGE